jgi:septal ring factor EnvC (AmiA/AmiB activator)
MERLKQQALIGISQGKYVISLSYVPPGSETPLTATGELLHGSIADLRSMGIDAYMMLFSALRDELSTRMISTDPLSSEQVNSMKTTIQPRLAALTNQRNDLEVELAALTNQRNTLQAKSTNIEASTHAMSTEIDALNAKLQELK